jgi:hypothetical protein
LKLNHFSETLANGFLGSADENEDGISVARLARNGWAEETDREFYEIWHKLTFLLEDPEMAAGLKPKLKILVHEIEAAYKAKIPCPFAALPGDADSQHRK